MIATRPRAEACPPTWQILAKHLALTPALARKWWRALWQRDDTCCVLVRSGVLLGDSGSAQLDPLTLLDKHLAPDKTVPCLERLVLLGNLTRHEGTMIQEHVLHKTTAGGIWRLSHREGQAHAHSK